MSISYLLLRTRLYAIVYHAQEDLSTHARAHLIKRVAAYKSGASNRINPSEAPLFFAANHDRERQGSKRKINGRLARREKLCHTIRV